MTKKLTPEQFLALPQPRKAVLLAKDVIAQIRGKQFEVSSGSYVDLVPKGEYESRNEVYKRIGTIGNKSAKDHLKEFSPHCEVCAKGALFMCHIGRANKATVRDVLEAGSRSIGERLVEQDKVFDRLSLDLIETAFERSYFGVVGRGEVWNDETMRFEGADHLEEGDQAMAFGGRFEEDDERLTAIMLNVIRNKGKFVPSDRVTRDEVRAALRVTKK